MLSDQEIRHALYSGPFDELLQELSRNEVIENFGRGKKGRSTRDAREGEELVLRFFAFLEDSENYEGNLSKFLDKYMKKASLFDCDKLSKLKSRFLKSLKACLIVFHKDEVFSDIGKTRTRQGIVYYDLLMSTLGKVDHATLRKNRDNIRAAFVELCKSNEFYKSTAGGLQRKSAINKRNRMWTKKLNEAIND